MGQISAYIRSILYRGSKIPFRQANEENEGKALERPKGTLYSVLQ